jgi:ABC-type branched-subunit amino acid transport system substrate-binding protein
MTIANALSEARSPIPGETTKIGPSSAPAAAARPEQSNLFKSLLGAAGAILLAGAAFAQDAIRIGVTQPPTGAFAADGNYVAQGAKLAADEINKAGLL